jgi:ADP-ribose pyrophosphatase YjhB (NUDIX family)
VSHKQEIPPRVYRNPKPVVVLLVPIQGESAIGLLTVRRNTNGMNQMALPGGYQNEGEPWRLAGARELFEETGVRLPDPLKIIPFGIEDGSGCRQVLLFGLCPPLLERDLPAFAPNDEVVERSILYSPTELAFPTHTEQARRFFSQLSAQQGAISD